MIKDEIVARVLLGSYGVSQLNDEKLAVQSN